MFAGTDAGLQESTDGGATWSLLAAPPGPMALAPDGSGGLRIVVAGPWLWVYDTLSRSLQRGPALPAGDTVDIVGFAGDVDHVIVGGMSLRSGAVVLRCDLALACAPVLNVSTACCVTSIGSPGAGASVIGVLIDGVLYISSDAGRSFTPLDLAGRRAQAVWINSSGAGPLGLVVWNKAAVQGVAIIDATGSHVTDLSAPVPAVPFVSSVLALPGGRVLTTQLVGNRTCLLVQRRRRPHLGEQRIGRRHQPERSIAARSMRLRTNTYPGLARSSQNARTGGISARSTAPRHQLVRRAAEPRWQDITGGAGARGVEWIDAASGSSCHSGERGDELVATERIVEGTT